MRFLLQVFQYISMSRCGLSSNFFISELFCKILNFLMIFVMFMFWYNTQKGLKVMSSSFFHITHVFFQKQFSAYKGKRKQKGDPKIKAHLSRIKSKIMKIAFIFPQLFKMHLISKSAKKYHLSPKSQTCPIVQRPRSKQLRVSIQAV